MEEEKQETATKETGKKIAEPEFKWQVGLRLDPDFPIDWELRW